VIELDQMLSDLATLVGIESPSGDVDALASCAAALANIIGQRLGSPAELIDGSAGPHVSWRGGEQSRVLLLGHYDTVFPLGALASRPFRVDGGRATGPGVFDMKAGIVQAIHAVGAMADRSGVEILMTSDEEVGSSTSRALIEARALACGSVLVLEPSADDGALKVGRKGVGTFEVVVHGRAAHAGLEPHKGVNSLVAAAELIGAIAGFGDTDLGTTVTPTIAVAGTAENVVPAETRMKIDVRVVAPGEKERIEQLMASLRTSVPEAMIEVLGGINRPPMHRSAAALLYPLAERAAAVAGITDLRGVEVGGGSDGNFTAAIGVPTLDGLGAVGGGAHADHEFVEVDTMVPRTAMLAGLIELVAARRD
jgi:glutamate carboxypeptidase